MSGLAHTSASKLQKCPDADTYILAGFWGSFWTQEACAKKDIKHWVWQDPRQLIGLTCSECPNYARLRYGKKQVEGDENVL